MLNYSIHLTISLCFVGISALWLVQVNPLSSGFYAIVVPPSFHFPYFIPISSLTHHHIYYTQKQFGNKLPLRPSVCIKLSKHGDYGI